MNKIILSLLVVVTFVVANFLTTGEVLLAQTETKKTPLKLTISTGEKLCSGKNITMEAKLENISDQNITIDTRYIWRYQTEKAYSRSSSNLLNIPDMRTSLGDSIDIDTPSEYFVTLKPGESFKDSHIIDATNDDFFKSSGKYSIKTGYGQFKDWSAEGFYLFIGKIDSNELEFQITDCNKKCDKK